MTGAFFASSARAAATLAAIMKSSTSRCASSRSRGAIEAIRPFSSSITRRSGRSSSSGSRFCRAANNARQQAHSGFSAFSTSSRGTGPSTSGIEQVGEATSIRFLRCRVDRRLRILVGNVCRDTNLRARESPAFERRRPCAIFRWQAIAARSSPCLQRADVRRQLLGQHRHHAVGEIDAVAARPRLAVELGAGADVEADVGDRDDRVPAALAVAPRPRSHRHGRARPRGRWRRSAGASGPRARPSGCFDTRCASSIASCANSCAQAMLVDRDQAEAARRERIAEHRIDARADPRRPAADFAQHQVARLRRPSGR